MRILAILLLPLTATLYAIPDTDYKCHSEQFTKAKSKLHQLVLTKAQKDAIATYEATFRRNWSRTHRSKGCSHHEAHASTFVAAAAGVLSDVQFKRFRGRQRNEVETLEHEVWQTGVYIDNLIKIANKL